MKKRMMTCLLALTAIFAFAFVSCKTNDDDDKGGNGAGAGVPAVDYESHNDYSVMVKNNTSYNLVAFKGSPSLASLIGGIPQNSTNHKLVNNRDLFTTSQDFMLFIVKEEDFKKNYSNLTALANKPFANIYAFYNANSSNNMVYEISSHLGGEGTITVQNTSNMNIELRMGGIYGETLGYVSEGMARTTFDVNYNAQTPADPYYAIYPVFRKYNKKKNEIMTVYPVYTTGVRAGKALRATAMVTPEEPNHTFNSSDWQSDTKFVSGYAYFQIVNNNQDVVQLKKGNQEQMTSTGKMAVNSGSTSVYQLEMPVSPGSSDSASYQTSATYDTLSITIIDNSVSIPTHTFKADYLYEITVSGNVNTGINISEISVIGKYDFAKDSFTDVTSDSE